MRRLSRIAVFLVMILLALRAAAAPPETRLSGLPIVISAKASDSTKKVGAELGEYLKHITGNEVKVEVGDGSAGIVLGRPSEFPASAVKVEFEAGPFHREDYIIRSAANGLYLLGASDLAVSHAAWDLLHRLGYRQYFPGATWEIVPPNSNASIAIDTRQSPSFAARRIWYNWGLWGYNDQPYRQWCTRNRAVKGFDLESGHSYESIISANKKEFDAHPEYLALVKGERKMRGDVKFCISNPGLRKLVADHAVRYFKRRPEADSISMDPSDGGNWCECDECSKMSVSDRVVMLANDVATAINDIGLGKKYVGMYAYNQHSAPPTIRVHPNVIPSATTAFIGGGYTFEQVVSGWQAQGATLGCYDYLSVVDWDWNLPRGSSGSRPYQLARFLPRLHKMGIRFYDAESGDCWGPAGLGYYIASRVLWDVGEAERVEAIVDDFLSKCFASAKAPMAEFYQLINNDSQRRSPSDIVGRMYRHLEAARKASNDAAVQQRINDLILYTRYVELYYAYANGRRPVEDVARHAYRMCKTMMIHSYGLWCRLISQKAALDAKHPLKTEEPFTAEEIDKFVSEGIANNQPVDPGFASLEFSRDLLPAASRLELPDVPLGSFPTVPQDRQQYYIWLAEPGNLELKITVQKVWAIRPAKISLYSPLEVSLNPVAVDDSYKPDGKTYQIVLKTPHRGLHRVETVDGGDYTRIIWPENMPVTIESSIDSPTATSHFRGPWTMYFYVPKGTKIVGGWASRIANWSPRISGQLVDPDGKTVIDFAKLEDGYFKATVAPGQDGKLWKFSNSQGQRLLMTVPPYLARNGAELLLPKDVVEADQKK